MPRESIIFQAKYKKKAVVLSPETLELLGATEGYIEEKGMVKRGDKEYRYNVLRVYELVEGD